MSKNYLKEAARLCLSIEWTNELMRSTLQKIVLQNPAAFIKAVKPKPTSFEIKIIDFPEDRKFAVLKAFREITKTTLSTAKTTIEGPRPMYVTTCASDKADLCVKQLEEAGAEVKIA